MLTKPSKNPAVKRSLVLAGGGMRVAYQAGVLMALEESGLQFSHVDGTSGGIFNTSMLASGLSPKTMAEKWRTLKLKYFVSTRKAKDYLHMFKMQGYADADNIRKKVFPHLGINLKTINANAEINTTFNVCNFRTKSVEAKPNTTVKEDHLIAGISLPLFMPAIKIDEDWYTDAVWIKDANLIESVNQGSKELWLVWAIGNSPNYLKGAFHQYVHMIEMSANGGLLEEYRYIHKLNELATADEKIKLFVIKSQIPLPLDPDFFFNKINARELVNMGYAHAKGYLENYKPEGELLDETASASEEPDFLLTFRSEYSGKLALNSKQTPVQLFTYTRFAQFPAKQVCEVYSSIKIGREELEIPTYNHEIIVGNEEWKGVSKFVLEGKEMTLTAVQKLSSPIEIVMGLGFKQIEIKVQAENGSTMIEGKLYQSMGSRLKSLYSTNLSTITDKRTGLRAKLKMFKAFINHVKTKTS
ncbi:patatin-like phospholipase family protein [Owenweeksia hongkongensis]|uniref:patatin-like phospholipase family protein n=1 Tax=Owenweeksia hongkongensis TaxID=253245 RepID=UPI003A95512B